MLPQFPCRTRRQLRFPIALLARGKNHSSLRQYSEPADRMFRTLVLESKDSVAGKRPVERPSRSPDPCAGPYEDQNPISSETPGPSLRDCVKGVLLPSLVLFQGRE